MRVDNPNAVLMTLLNGIFENNRLIVYKLDAQVIDLHLVQGNEGIHPRVYHDARTLAHHKNVVQDYWLRVLALNEHPRQSTGDQGVVSEYADVSLIQVGYKSAALKRMEL